MSNQIFHDGRAVLLAGDCLERLKELPDCSVDSVVTDPPYHLTSIVKRFGGENAAPAMSAAQRRFAKTGGADRKPGPDQYGRLTKGFMGKQWDGGDIAFRVELWAECWRVLKPGGHLIAFSGSRTYHRMVVAIEDAGFEVRDMIAWLYGSGFPKSHDISKAIDRMAGAEREIVSQGAPVKRMIPGADQHKDGWEKTNGRVYVPTETAPATEEAAQWEGWGTALKPAIEPICLARKPLSEKTVAANVLRWGVGAINEDACRVPTSDQLSGSGTPPLRYGGENSRPFHSEAIPQGCSQHPGGRHPANVVHDGSPEVVGAFPAEAGAFAPVRGTEPSNAITNVYGERVRVATTHHGDSGSAARFFASFPEQNEARCCLCGLLSEPFPATEQTCDALIAEPDSPTENILNEGSVRCDVADLRPPESVGSQNLLIDRAPNAESHSEATHQTRGSFAHANAPSLPLSKIVQNVRSAASLCVSCGTGIAQSLVAMRLGQDPALPLCQVSISDHKRQILTQSLALYVAGRESTDTITTIPSLKMLFGSVFHAIADTIKLEKAGNAANLERGPKRLFYSSKADRNDRIGSKHPTVKPVDLMRWLVRLVTPPGGTVLDPFSGSGTTGEAALLEGFKAVMVEREPEYQADIARRMALVFAGETERAHAIVKARGEEESHDTLPLFGGGA